MCLNPIRPVDTVNPSYHPPPLNIPDSMMLASTHLTQATYVTDAAYPTPLPAYFACRTTRAGFKTSSAFVKYSAGRFMGRIHSA
jgi:hypothetical protein